MPYLVGPDVELFKQAAARMARRQAEILHDESMEKDAILRVGKLLEWGRRGAAALARKEGRIGQVGSLLQRPLQSPLQAVRTGPAGVHLGLQSPLGKAPQAVTALSQGPYRSAGSRVAGKLPETAQAAAKFPPKREAGLVRDMLKGVAVPALLAGGGYAAYKGAKGAVGLAREAVENPYPYSRGLQQYQYGYAPGGQAQF